MGAVRTVGRNQRNLDQNQPDPKHSVSGDARPFKIRLTRPQRRRSVVILHPVGRSGVICRLLSRELSRYPRPSVAITGSRSLLPLDG